MKLLIAGLGEMGLRFIDLIQDEEFEIYLVDKNIKKFDALKHRKNLHLINENIIQSKQIEKLNLSEFDFYFSITDSDEVNMTTCKFYKDQGVKKSICRLNNLEIDNITQEFSSKLNIDHFINPNSILADKLHILAQAPNVIDYHNFCSNQIQVLGFRIKDASKIIGMTFLEIKKDLVASNFEPIILQKHQQTHFIPDQTIVEIGDILYFVTLKDHFQAIRKYLGYKKRKEKNIMILGGDHISHLLAQRLEENNFQVKIIEKDKTNAFVLSQQLSNTNIFCIDGTDERALISAGLKETDYFFALTNDISTNVISCLIANDHNIKYTFCLIEQKALCAIFNELDEIFYSFNLRDYAAKALYQYIHRSDFANYYSVLNSSIEILEIRIENQKKLIVDNIKQIELPEGVVILLVYQNSRFQFAYQEPAVQKGDSILILLNRIDREAIMSFFTQK